MASFATNNETLGGRVEITSHDEYLGPMDANIDTSVPDVVLWEGAFRGCTSSGQIFDDFTMVFERLRLAGKGFMNEKPIFMHGKFSRPSENKCKLAVSMIAPQITGGEIRSELRLEFTEAVVDHTGQNHGPGFMGDLHQLEGNELRTEKVFIWITPAEEKSCGYFVFEFTTPMCGLEHTGSFPLWHGVGAEIKRVQGQAALKGMRPGDVIRTINEEVVRPQQRSRDISQLIKAAPRPCYIRIFREIIPKEPYGEAAGEDPEAEREEMIETFNEMETITARLKEDMMASLGEKRKSLTARRLSRTESQQFTMS